MFIRTTALLIAVVLLAGWMHGSGLLIDQSGLLTDQSGNLLTDASGNLLQ